MKSILVASLLCFSTPAFSQMHHDHDSKSSAEAETAEHIHPMGPSDCGAMEVWDYSAAMCSPLAMAGMPMRMAMIHGNSFLTQTVEEGRRGRNAFTVPNMFMADIGSSVGDSHYVNLSFMGTLELWTYPKDGYPLLLQIGEENADHEKYIDAQHPHSSPIMGLTLSDTISLGSGKDHAKVWFSPRGSSTEGPVAFMHRPTGLVNPDAPLGHHIGQDVGHITSSVAGASISLAGTTLEVSAFNGTEPQPSKVDLPVDKLNSYAARFIQQFGRHVYAMTSAAYVKDPEPHDPALDHIWRYSASLYNDFTFQNGWMIHNTLIYGLVNHYDGASALNSFGEELWLHKNKKSIWGRIEHLQRTPAELDVISLAPNDPLWVTALTLGYTHQIAKWDSAEVGLGGSVTKNILPSDYREAYSGDPVSGKIFLQVGGMKMWDLAE